MHFTQQVTSKLTTNETTENQITHRNVYIGSLLYNTNSLCTDCYVDARTGLLSVGNERCIVVLSFPPNHSHALSHFHETTPVLPISTRTFPWDSHEIDGISDIDSSQQACTYSGSGCGWDVTDKDSVLSRCSVNVLQRIDKLRLFPTLHTVRHTHTVIQTDRQTDRRGNSTVSTNANIYWHNKLCDKLTNSYISQPPAKPVKNAWHCHVSLRIYITKTQTTSVPLMSENG